MRTIGAILFACLTALAAAKAETARLAGDAMLVEIDTASGQWSLLDRASGVRWPSQGSASAAKGLEGRFEKPQAAEGTVRLSTAGGAGVTFAMADAGRTLEIRWEGPRTGDILALDDALGITDAEGGCVIVPCREGLLIPADSGLAFRHVFGTSEYEGCHMNMLGLVKSGSAMAVTWDDACVWAEVHSACPKGEKFRQRLTVGFRLGRTARCLRMHPLGKGDWNTVAGGYRAIAQAKGLPVTLRQKIARNPRLERMVGASNVKLWTCLARRMNEESTKEESVKVHWTFDEAAAVAEHLHTDLQIDRCLFILGGWTESGYDCRHPDNLPANPECGGNDALAKAVGRIQNLPYVACLHDNYQDMYRDARSWNPAFIEKHPDGSLIQGGRWLGGRAYMVCAVKQLELARRPQNLPATRKLFSPWCYFIDTTYAVGPRECSDPNHPIDRNKDISLKADLSDYAREVFGLFGSECGREWALPHSDFFEGLSGVAGRYFHNLDPRSLGARVIPFWEMVYHDCQIVYGKYGYAADRAGEYVAHHVLCARPLNYHSMGDHLYWKPPPSAGAAGGGAAAPDQACFTRCDQGWASGLHPTDVFLKNTHEVLGPLHAVTAHQRLERLELLAPDAAVRRATYGSGTAATSVAANFGPGDATVKSRFGGSVVLPPWGFVVDGPGFAAFYAKRWGGTEYPKGALFTLRPAAGQTLDQPAKVRVFHAFGQTAIAWKGKTHQVRRELEIAAE